MDYMHSNGFSYTQEEIEEAAKKKGISIEDYLVETPELSMEGKQNGLAEDSTPSPENTELKSEVGGSEREEPDLYNTGWGDKLYNGLRDSWLGKSVRAGSLNSANDGLTKEEGLARVKKEVEDERKADEVRRSDDAWTSQSTDFSRNLDDMFNDPEMFQKILGDEETLQNRNAEGGGGLNSAEHLKGIIKDQIGGMGWFDDRKVDPTTGQPVYSRLTNSDMDALISEKFEAKLYEEQTNVSNGRGTAKNLARQKDGISLEEYWSEDSNTTISSFTGNDKKLAELYKDIKSGSLNEVDMIKKSKQFKELRAKEGKHHMVLDPKTGMLRVASDDKHRDKLLEDGHIPLDINGKQKEYENITDYDVLKQEYQRSALSLGGLNDELKTMRTAEVDNPAYTSVAGRDKDLVKDLPKKISVTKSTKDWLQDIHTGVVMDGQTQDEWEEEKVRLQEDVVDYNSDHEALKRMYFLNEGIKDQDIGVMGHLATSAKSFIEPFIGEYNTDQLMGGQTDRVILDKVGEKYNQMGYEVTPEDEEYLERGVGEMVNEGLFGSARILAEFYAVNKIAKPLQAITGLTKYMNTLQGGRWVKNGKTFTDANIKARAAARGMSTDKYIKTLGKRVSGFDSAKGLQGMRFTTNSIRDRGVATLITGGIEGAKFSAIEAFDEGDVSVKGFATGFGFGVGGRILAPLAPYMQKNGLLKDFDKKLGKIKGKQRSVNVNTRKLFETFITQPASFVAGSEFGEVMSAVTQDAMGNKQFSDFMDEHYGDYGEVGKRLITNGFIGLGFGMTHFKGFGDYKSKAGLRNSFKKSKKLMQQIAVEKGGVTQLEINRSKQGFFDPEIQAKIEKNLSDKNLKEYYKHWEVKDGLQKRYLDAVRAEGYMDPSRANEIVKREHKQEIKDAKEQGIDIEIEVVNNNRLKFGQEAMINKEGNAFNADVVRKGNKIKYRYNAELYTPDIKAHEMSHDYFEREFGYNAVFKGDFFKKLESVGSKIELDKNLSEKEAVELGTPMLAGTTMNLSQAMKLKKFDLTDAVKNQKIQQWELFSYIAERIGDKSNYNNIKGSDGFLGLRNVISEFGKRGGQKYDLTQEKDVVRWFRDYAKNVKKGVNQTKMFKELESVIDADGPLLKKAELAAQGKTGKNKYSSEILELEGGGKVNNPEKLKNEAQEYFKAKGIKLGEGKIEDYRELMGQKERRGDRKMEMDINSPHTDFERYPILGNKLGPMFDIALNLYQRTIPERYRVDANNKSWDGERAELAVASLTDKRGFQDIFRTYDPAKGTLMSHVTGMLKTRMEEIKYRSVDAKYESRRAEAEGSVVSGQDISDIKTDIIDINASGGIAKGGESGKTVAENTGIRLRDFEFNYGGGIKKKINPQSVERLEQASEDVFFETPLNELTFVNVANKMRGKSSPEMDLLFRGGKTDLKTPRDIKLAEDAFVNNNGSINFEAMKLFSSPKFYENSNWGKTIFNKFYKNTGVKFNSTELPVEVTKETNARTTKWKKLTATEARVQEFVDLTNSGRDAGTINKKRNTLKEGIGDPFALQIFRDRILSPEFEAKVAANPEAKAKLEGLRAELALRKLRGATPEGLRSDILDNMIRDVRKMDFTNERFPGFNIRSLVERNPEYFKELERSGGAEAYFNSMGYELKGVDLKTFQNYFEAQRFLEMNPEMKPFVPELGYKNYSDKNFIKTVESLMPEAIRGESKMAEKKWYENPRAVTEFDTFIKEFYNGLPSEMINHPVMRKAIGIGMGKQKLNGEYRGKDWADKWYSENKGTGKAPAYIKHVKATSNGPFKKKVNGLLDLPKFNKVKNSEKLQREIATEAKKYLTKKGSTYEQTTDANTKLHAKVYEKLFDYYVKSNNKALALNNIRRLLQMQTNVEGGFAKGLATHDAVSLNKGAKHSEHDFQLFNMNANFMINTLKNSGNKATFLKNQKSLSKIFKQSIIDKSVQEKFDGDKYGGATSYDFKFTTESGKYPWMRELALAETTLDLKSGKTYDRLLTDVITGGRGVKELLKRKQILNKVNNKKFADRGLKSEDLTSGEKHLAAKSVDAAIAKGRMKNKKPKGMSAWDFDDTLATTKSGVRAIIPNVGGLPKPNRKVIFLAGGAGSGKGNVIKKLNLEKQGFKLVNSDISLEWLKKNDGLPENMNDLTKEQRSTLGKLQYQSRQIAKNKLMKYKGNAEGVVVDGTGGSIKSMEKLVNEFKEKGYDVSMLFVETSLPTALARNKARAERSLLDKIVERNHEAVQGNKKGFVDMFGERFMEVKTDNLKQESAMPKDLVDKMNDFVSGYEKIRLDAEQFATEGKSILDRGGKFDFSEFNVVTKGEKGPFFQKALDRAKKFGLKDQFVLTARPPEAAVPIFEFLKAQGLEIPLENITGLGNSTGEAKAAWMLKKFAEGYNDMYFADDAIQNVKAVRDVLSQLDIKSKVQQALMSENLSEGVNSIMEHSLDIGSKKVFSKAEAKVRGKDIKRRRVFMRDSAADLELLIEPLYGKGKKGIENKEWFKEKFVMPFERGTRDYNSARQSAKNDYMNLRKQNKDVVKKISEPVEGTAFTNDMAMRVYLWNKAGYKIPDLAKTTEAKLIGHIQNNPKLQAYAENFARITKQDKGLKEPGENWWGETMAGEVTNINRGVSRKQYLKEWIDVKNEIFTEENLNKMESKLGTEWRENITDMFDRMETGRTRSLKMDRGSAAMMNYLNGGIGTIMNFNTRSAVLQVISTTNFLNMRENNPIAAAKAMGNAKQFAKDFKYIMNSDMLKQRRDGLAMNVTEAEIASAAASSQNPVQSIISKVLKAGYLPTKMADSFAISFGGATFYRNRVKMYEKQGVKTKEAESKAFLDFQMIAERTQQSSRADLLSKQQTSLIGRFILPFANTPMQMNRAGMKDILDISKGRFEGGRELSEKIGRVSYYMGAQVAIFAGLQSTLFAMLLNDEDVSDEKLANTKSMMLNTTADSMLRGFGIQGAILSASKNAIQEYIKQDSKPGFTADYSEVAEKLLNVSPPIGSKFGMLDRAGDRKKWAKIKKNDEFKFELGNPSLEASLMTIQATTNAPVYSPYQNLFNMQHALNDQYETWQRILMAAGWTPYSVAVETEDKKKKKSGPIVYPVIR